MPNSDRKYASPSSNEAGVDKAIVEKLAAMEMDFEDVEALYGEEMAIEVGIARDPDCPELTAEEMAEMRPAIEVDPEIVMAYRRGELRIRPDLLAKRDNGGMEPGQPSGGEA